MSAITLQRECGKLGSTGWVEVCRPRQIRAARRQTRAAAYPIMDTEAMDCIKDIVNLFAAWISLVLYTAWLGDRLLEHLVSRLPVLLWIAFWPWLSTVGFMLRLPAKLFGAVSDYGRIPRRQSMPDRHGIEASIVVTSEPPAPARTQKRERARQSREGALYAELELERAELARLRRQYDLLLARDRAQVDTLNDQHERILRLESMVYHRRR